MASENIRRISRSLLLYFGGITFDSTKLVKKTDGTKRFDYQSLTVFPYTGFCIGGFRHLFFAVISQTFLNHFAAMYTSDNQALTTRSPHRWIPPDYVVMC